MPMNRKPISSEKTVGLVLNVHRDPGVGMLESLYEHSFAAELTKDGLAYQQQAKMPTGAKPEKIRQNYRIDLLINGKMVVELKGVVPGPA